jgi:hypothetical protein
LFHSVGLSLSAFPGDEFMNTREWFATTVVSEETKVGVVQPELCFLFLSSNPFDEPQFFDMASMAKT